MHDAEIDILQPATLMRDGGDRPAEEQQLAPRGVRGHGGVQIHHRPTLVVRDHPHIGGRWGSRRLRETARALDLLRRALRHETDAAKLSGTVARMGANGRYQVTGEKLQIELEFGLLVPGPIQKRVADEVNGKLDGLFAS